MKYLDEFRNAEKVRLLSRVLEDLPPRPFVFMEVCGTHTRSIFHHGLRSVFPSWVKHLSGPGCPVCVTPNDVLDYAITLSLQKDVILVTFGDMFKVPGSYSSLEEARAKGGRIKIVYSPLDALNLAERESSFKVVFLAVGFETTAPLVAQTVLEARKRRIKNFFIISAHKLIPPALDALLSQGVNLDGFILPGHVSTIIGRVPYLFLREKYNKGAVISGFEPLDILLSLRMLIQMREEKRADVLNEYRRSVREEGNTRAKEIMDKVFKVGDSNWRGIGNIPLSGLELREEFEEFDAQKRIPLDLPPSQEFPGCRCGEVLAGKITPLECPLFSRACTPRTPRGPCMVSIEGACGIYYQYGERR